MNKIEKEKKKRYKMRILDKKTIKDMDCSVCVHVGQKRKTKMHRTGEKEYIFIKTCKLEKCPYKNTLKT